tara:strand:- start:391 stop:591 length:201 start_codon:yes stop_codon:yes gene_type:complete
MTALFEGENKFIDTNTAVLIITFNSYEPAVDRFIVSQITVEFTLAGMLHPSPLKIVPFVLDLREQL